MDAVALYDILLVIAVVTTVLASTPRSPSVPAAFRPVIGGMALLGTAALLGAAFGREPSASVVSSASFAFTTLGPLVAVALWWPTLPELRSFFGLFLAGAVCSSAYAVVIGPTVAGRRLGLASHPNSLGLACVLGTGVALGFALARRGRPRLGPSACAGILAVGLLASGSRAALLGMAAMVPAVALVSSRRRVALATAAVAVLTVGAVVLGTARAPVHQALGRIGGDRSTSESDAQRLDQLAGSLDRVKDNPLTGVGLQEAQAAHSVYLQAVVAAGPLGLVGLVLAIGGVLVATRRGIASGRTAGTKDGALMAGVTGAYIGYLVAGTFQNSLSDRTLWLFVAGTVALASGLTSAGRVRRSGDTRTVVSTARGEN